MNRTSATRTARRSERQQEREAVLEAAERLLAAEGAAGLSVRRLAEEAGASTVAIYVHFGDKLGLEEALLERAAASVEGAVAAAVDDAEAGEPPGDAFRAACEAFRLWAATHPARFDLLFTRAAADHELAEEADAAVLRCAARLAASAPGGGGTRWAVTTLATLVGLAAFEARELLEPAERARSFDELVEALRATVPVAAG